MSEGVPYPISCEVDGRTWDLFSVDWTGPDGRYSFHIYALSWEHAEMILQEIKETAKVSGKIGGIVAVG